MKVNEYTGEVIDSPKFRSMWSNPFGLTGQDLSNELEDVYEEVGPFAIDPETGQFLNDSSVPKIIAKGKINVWEKIQSFAKDVDLYTILEKFAYNDDLSLLNARACSYGDISELPNNLNDFAKCVDVHLDKLKELNPELAKMVIDDSYSPADIEAKANEILNERIAASEAAKKEGE